MPRSQKARGDWATRLTLLGVALGAVMVALVVRCSVDNASATPRLVVPNANGFHMGIPRVPPNAPWVIKGMTICADSPGTIELTEVKTIGSDVQVVDYALRDNPAWAKGVTFGDELSQDWPGDLEAAGFDPAVKTVSLTCGKPGSGKGHEIGIELRSPSNGVAKIDGFEILYERDGKTVSASIRMGVTLCPYKNSWHPKCTNDAETD